jgi:hypothetical protein
MMCHRKIAGYTIHNLPAGFLVWLALPCISAVSTPAIFAALKIYLPGFPAKTKRPEV